MIDREIDVDREINRQVREASKQQYEIAKEINSMLAYGAINLGLNQVDKENDSEKRVKEDLNRVIK
ncbi:hypothetical protein GOM49_03085 [Clostridium bovifaecis]|uniref:Uncharacterized protein n=1 Tax=Clostridium bovifaecis TaxID=2184719 RepID=A0A6I6EVQ9_9CLOT|nr:hypothetical protein GOM49_03085 [Clostridium bovifaecis]